MGVVVDGGGTPPGAGAVMENESPLSALKAWIADLFVDPPSALPERLKAVKLNPALMALHMDGTHRQNVDVDATPWIGATKKRRKRR